MRELERSQRMAAPSSKRDKRKYCYFYRDHGHDTESCFQLKEELEWLLKRGFLAKSHKCHSGGTAAGGDSNSTRKSYTQSSGVGTNQKKTRFSQDITFGEKDPIGIVYPHDDALVITGDIADFDVKRVLIDNGSAADVLTWDALLGLKAPLEKLRPVNTPLQGFGGATVTFERTMELPVTLGTYPTSITLMTNFLVVKTPMAYNAIYGIPLLNVARAVVSTYHQSMKFPTSRGVRCVRGDQYVSRRCYIDSIQVRKVEPVMMLNIEPLNRRIEPLNTIEKIEVADRKMLVICGGLQSEEREREREKTVVRTTTYKQKAAEYFNRQVKPIIFQTRDLVLRNATTAKHPLTKLGANWKGSYEVIISVGKGAYRLKDLKGKPLAGVGTGEKSPATSFRGHQSRVPPPSKEDWLITLPVMKTAKDIQS
ncbi:Beta-porphyranase [Abeliophyllum distichum]|uniref:Beta-porphyranase n=1 Tax=Abeliophyllum distichum TaxID=126358 RepID=A0ABD1PDQ0_9LAMI